MDFILYCVFIALCVWCAEGAYTEWQSSMDDYWILAGLYGCTAIVCFIAAGTVGR